MFPLKWSISLTEGPVATTWRPVYGLCSAHDRPLAMRPTTPLREHMLQRYGSPVLSVVHQSKRQRGPHEKFREITITGRHDRIPPPSEAVQRIRETADILRRSERDPAVTPAMHELGDDVVVHVERAVLPNGTRKHVVA